MWSHWIRIGALLLLAATLGASIAGCSKKETTAPESERLNGDKPNGNARILSQTRIGDADNHTTVWEVCSADDLSLGFSASYNGSAGIGVLSSGGTVRWFVPLPDVGTELVTLPGAAVVPRGLVVAGWRDTDGDMDSDVGLVSLYSSAGSLLSQVVLASDSSEIFLNAVVPVGDSSFVACGGEERRSGIIHPYLAQVHLKSPGRLEAGRTTVLQILSGRFTQLVTLPSSPGYLGLAATSIDGTTRKINGLRSPWPGFDPVAVEWSTEIVPTAGTWYALHELALAGDNLYVVGAVNDDRKTPVPANGGFWRSGLVASFTIGGAQRWSRIVSLTGHMDEFRNITAGPDAVYAVGIAANYFRGDPGDTFGYGLISKLDLGTGQVLASFTVGEDRYDAGFNTATWTTAGLICAGWTDFEVRTGPYRGWIPTVNVSDTLGASSLATPRTMATQGDRAPQSLLRGDRDTR